MLSHLTLSTNFVLQHLLIGFGVVLALGIASRVFRLSAELQSWLWVTAFAICALVPLAVLLPDIDRPRSAAESAAQTSVAAVNPNAGSAIQKTDQHTPVQPNDDRALEWQVSRRWAENATVGLQGFLLIWLLGGAWRAFSMVQSIRCTRSLVRFAKPLPGNRSLLPSVDCPILVSESASAPMAAGLLKPVILLPRHLVEQFEQQRLAPILLHEWAHIRRRDLWVAAIQELLAIVYWWSPALRIINRRIHISRELACDMRAAKALENGRQYAQSLLDCAELMVTRQQNVMAMGLFSRRKDLTERINAVLKFKYEKTPKLLAVAAVCAIFSLTGISAAQEFKPRIGLSAAEENAKTSPVLSRLEGEMMIEVIRSNNIQAVREMLNMDLDINTPVAGEGTALIEAVRQNNRKIAELLLQSGADVNQASRGDGNPLIAAAENNQLELAELLYRQGADLNVAIPRDGSPLIVAVRRGHNALAEQLIEWGADVNQASEWDGNPLIAAAVTGNLPMAKRLIQKGADINGIVPTDETPLINASHQGHFEMVRFLVNSGADVNLGVTNQHGHRTPPQHGAEFGNSRVSYWNGRDKLRHTHLGARKKCG